MKKNLNRKKKFAKSKQSHCLKNDVSPSPIAFTPDETEEEANNGLRPPITATVSVAITETLPVAATATVLPILMSSPNRIDSDFAFEQAQPYILQSIDHAIELLKEVKQGRYFTRAKIQLANLEYQLSENCPDSAHRPVHLKNSLFHHFESLSETHGPIDEIFDLKLHRYVEDTRNRMIPFLPFLDINGQLLHRIRILIDKVYQLKQGELVGRRQRPSKPITAITATQVRSIVIPFKSYNPNLTVEFSRQRRGLFWHMMETGITNRLLSSVNSSRTILRTVVRLDAIIVQKNFDLIITELESVNFFPLINELLLAVGKYLLPLSFQHAYQALSLILPESCVYVEAQKLLVDIQNYFVDSQNDLAKKQAHQQSILEHRFNICTRPTDTLEYQSNIYPPPVAADRLTLSELCDLISACNCCAGELEIVPCICANPQGQALFGIDPNGYYARDSWAATRIYFNILMYFAETLKSQLQRMRVLQSTQTISRLTLAKSPNSAVTSSSASTPSMRSTLTFSSRASSLRGSNLSSSSVSPNSAYSMISAPKPWVQSLTTTKSNRRVKLER